MAKLNTYGLNLTGVDEVTDRVYYESDSIRQLGIVAQKKSAQWIYDRAIKLYEE